jgi:hypothetical protein
MENIIYISLLQRILKFNDFCRRRETFVTRISFFQKLLGSHSRHCSFPQDPWKDQKVRIEELVAHADYSVIYLPENSGFFWSHVFAVSTFLLGNHSCFPDHYPAV